MTYVPALGKYLMVVSTPTISPFTVLQFDTYILESDSMTGPWHSVVYMQQFGPEAYFVNIPSKWLSPARPAPGQPYEAVLSYSANFAGMKDLAYPTDSGYYWCLLPIRLTVSS
eukprot:m.833 g.833  ORF g.833 m.833 type:complete len:113 (-) comp199_c0_seq2:159-497(-)